MMPVEQMLRSNTLFEIIEPSSWAVIMGSNLDLLVETTYWYPQINKFISKMKLKAKGKTNNNNNIK